MAVDGTNERNECETSTLQFIVAWAEQRAGGERKGSASRLTPPEVSVVARQAARLLGERPLRGVTFGDLARLPTLLEAGGMAPATARTACREIGCALRKAIGGWATRAEARRAAAGRR